MFPFSACISFYSLVYISALLQHKEFLLVLSATLTTRKGKACLSAPLLVSLSLPPPPQPDSRSLLLLHFPLPDLWLQAVSQIISLGFSYPALFTLSDLLRSSLLIHTSKTTTLVVVQFFHFVYRADVPYSHLAEKSICNQMSNLLLSLLNQLINHLSSCQLAFTAKLTAWCLWPYIYCTDITVVLLFLCNYLTM